MFPSARQDFGEPPWIFWLQYGVGGISQFVEKVVSTWNINFNPLSLLEWNEIKSEHRLWLVSRNAHYVRKGIKNDFWKWWAQLSLEWKQKRKRKNQLQKAARKDNWEEIKKVIPCGITFFRELKFSWRYLGESNERIHMLDVV